ncbi:hypothetical protein SSX86_025417 [Deinandra increscens subsp. villosa]|uniref:LNS2/PITP domain-containing protein n=1 Tax=Deinandra increscens subsp. villosa TaxID=3103831 RepID=A0AAP0CJF0_9ASTR
MYAVGRLITQGANTISGPFHPFGGAVDMVVVQQQDGSLKSSPWYVKFGKFQGVLKAKVGVVDINVNGVDAGFHMFLDTRGEAYFLREVDSDEVVKPGSGSLHSSSCKSMSYEFDRCNSVSDVSNGVVLSRTGSKRSRILGFALGKRSLKEHGLSKEENDSNVGGITQLESAEIAADLLEMRWSTNLSFKSSTEISRDSRNDNGDVTGGKLEAGLVLHEEHFVNKLENSHVDQEVTDFVNGVNKDNNESFVSDESSRTQLDDANEAKVGLITAQGSSEIVKDRYKEVASNQEDASIEDVSCSSISVPFCQNLDDNLAKEVEKSNGIIPLLETNGDIQVSERCVEEQLIFGDLDAPKLSIDKIEQEVKQVGSESMSTMYCPDPLTVGTYQEHSEEDLEGLKGNIRMCASNMDIPRSCEVTEAEVGRQAKSLPDMRSHFNDQVKDNHEDPQCDSHVGKLRSSNWDLLREDVLRIKKANLEKKLSQNVDNLSNGPNDGSVTSGGPPNMVDGGGGKWRLWPFKRLGSKNVSQNSENNSSVDDVAETDIEKEQSATKSDKMYIRALTPTSEQLASLNLAEGKNIVTFTFSTSVLGTQKVDARIYLWRWDTRIVISDVDGTITKSDVLGQFMPLVGRDWSHIGVTHLFAAIKIEKRLSEFNGTDNGYKILYLSARAISQASNTRQFLFNLKQDGKALPDGPVVISPDGLFPSFFREVIRRVPHEFKIACLEDIKVCFPSDRNPFYAGFGNRHTDEFSYLKVGIPKGKIFIINHKGEVVINRSIDSRSYASIHALANGIFPPISGHEEPEGYNSWNFWKLPRPTMD